MNESFSAPTSAARESKAGRLVATVLLFAAIGWFVVRGPFWPPASRLWDYAVFTSGGDVWLKGGDPYDNDLVNRLWVERGAGLNMRLEPTWVRSNAPPSTYALMSPFGALPTTPAGVFYIGLTSALLAYAAHRIAVWAGVNGATSWRLYWAWLLVSLPMIVSLKSGNPVAIAAPLALIGLERARRTPGMLPGILLGLAAAAKVQVVLPLIVFAGFCRLWKAAGIGVAVWLTIFAVAVVRLESAGVDWRSGVAANLADTNTPGGMNDYTAEPRFDGIFRPHLAADLVMLQTPVWQLTRSRVAAEGIAWAVFGLGVTTLAVLAWRRRDAGGQATLIGLGTAGALCLMPIYHRTYDALIVLPLLAAGFAGLRSTDRTTRRLSILIIACYVACWLPVGIYTPITKRPGLDGLAANPLYRAAFVAAKSWAICAHAALGLLLLSRLPITLPADVRVGAGPEKLQIEG